MLPASIRPSASDYRRLLGELAADGCLPDNVVHAWSLCIGTDTPPVSCQRSRVISAMLLAQSLLSPLWCRAFGF